MGCASSKDDGGGGMTSAHNGGPVTTKSDKSATFRERRLSTSQMADPNAPRRRLSVYGGKQEEGSQPSVVSSPMESCGCKTLHGIEPVPGGSAAKINQDRGLAIYPFLEEGQGLFGVYDGHGKIGEKVSEYVIQNLPGELEAHADELVKNPGAIMSDAYVTVDTTLADNIDASVSGTTAVTCLIKQGKIWTANSGDSRAVIMRREPNGSLRAIEITQDHKPDSPEEMKRILKAGGHVTPAGSNGSPSRVWHNFRGLAMARSIGDHAAATVGVIAEPEISEYVVHEDDFMLIIASDGVWELLESQKVAEIVQSIQSGDPTEICEEITQQSAYMWKVEEGDYRDDITVVALKFPWLPQ